MLDWDSWFSIATILGIGIFVQSAAGFAAGLCSIPIMLWIGLPLPEATTALLVATIPQNLFGIYTLRKSIQPRKMVWPGVGRIAFLPLGMITLSMVEQSFPVVRIRQFVGAVVLTITIATLIYRPEPKEKLATFWSWIAFPTSGFLQGLVGMGGPAMVFWVTAHDWSTRQIRGFLFGMYAISLLPAFVCLYSIFGDRIWMPAAQSAVSIPLLLLATWLGLKFGDWLGRDRLKVVMMGLLMGVGIVGLAAPWFKT